MRRSKSGLFLMEIMFAILFFSLAGAVCLQLFVKAHSLSRDAKTLDAAVTVCQSAAAVLEAEGADALAARFDGVWTDDVFTAPQGDCLLKVSENEDFYDIRALESSGDTELYSLELRKKIS